MPVLLPRGIQISQVDLDALEHVVPDAEVWITTLIQNKIANSRKTMRRDWVDRLIDNPEFNDPLPSDEDQLLTVIKGRPDYKKRSDRVDQPPNRG